MLLEWLQAALPAPIDYVIVVADTSTPQWNSGGYQAVTSFLKTQMKQIGTSSGRPFVSVYRRNSLNAGVEK